VGFQMYQTASLDQSDEDDSTSSVETYRSALKGTYYRSAPNYRSAPSEQPWTVKKPKNRKHKPTTDSPNNSAQLQSPTATDRRSVLGTVESTKDAQTDRTRVSDY
jgi:hypothetical protein